MKKITLVSLIILLAAVPAAAELEVGPGLRFDNQQVYLRDQQGRYFQTDLQELLGTLSAKYSSGPWRAQLTGAWADWNPAGNWQGSNLELTALNPFYWEWQEDLCATATYELWHGLSVGAGYSDTSVRHYRGDDQFTYLQYRCRAAEALVQYNLSPGWGLKFSAVAAYAPYTAFAAYVNSNVPADYPAVHASDTAGTGTRWRGSVQGSYRFPWGLGVELVYEQGFADFLSPSNAEEFSLSFGHLSGFLALAF